MISVPPAALVLLVLVAGSVGHALALLAMRRGHARRQVVAAGLAQAALLAALVGMSVRWLETSDPANWLPVFSTDALQAAATLALALYLVAGFWWQSPGLGLTVPACVVGLLALAEVATGGGAFARGLPLDASARPATGAVLVAALALMTLATAGLTARWVEGKFLGAPRLDRRVIAWLVAIATVLVTGVLALVAAIWLPRARLGIMWSLQQTWLLATWVTLVTAAVNAGRRRVPLPTLAIVAGTLLLIGVTIVPDAGGRP
jgi:hypothetical protein